MAEVLRCADRWGREITVDDDVWYDKILVIHHEMDSQLDAVERALVDPDRVNHDARHSRGENYYRLGVLEHPNDIDYLKVVVRFDEDDLGRQFGTVVSA